MNNSILTKILFALSKYFSVSILLRTLNTVKFQYKVNPYTHWERTQGLVLERIRTKTKELYTYRDCSFNLISKGAKEVPIGDPMIEVFVTNNLSQPLAIIEMEAIFENMINVEHAGGKGGPETPEDIKLIKPVYSFLIDCERLKARIVDKFTIVPSKNPYYIEIKKFAPYTIKLDIPSAFQVAVGQISSLKFSLGNYIGNVPTYFEFRIRLRTNFGEINSPAIGLEQLENINVGYS